MEKLKVQILLEDIPENKYEEIILNIEEFINEIQLSFHFNYDIGIGEPDA